MTKIRTLDQLEPKYKLSLPDPYFEVNAGSDFISTALDNSVDYLANTRSWISKLHKGYTMKELQDTSN